MAIENSVSINFLSTFVDSSNVFNCRLSGVRKLGLVMMVVSSPTSLGCGP